MYTQRFVIFLNLLSLYLYFTGLFKIKKPLNTRSTFKSEAKYKKLIFILLDGLRIDGAVNTEHNTLYHNNFKFMNSISNNNKMTFLSIAGLPTATSIRVKSILTGMPSNFLDGIGTFAHSNINIDSFIENIKNDSYYFYGDSTWIDFFPILKENSKSIPPYGTGHSIKGEIDCMNELVDNLDKFKFNIGHFIYLDHYGHKYTIHSENVKDIMIKYDNMIEKIYNKMDDETLFVIYSDHGVKDNGNHGGASRDEICSTAVFMSKKPFKYNENKILKNLRESYLLKFYDAGSDWIKTKDKLEIIHQNDIMPTTCSLLGLPIPFNSYGNLIYELVGEDETLFYEFAKQKALALSKKSINLPKDIYELVTINYKLSNEIYKNFSGHNIHKVLLSLVLISLSLLLSIRKNITLFIFDKQNLLYIFAIIMVAHSVYSFLHEDLIWGILYLINNPTLKSIFILFFYLHIGKFPQHEMDRFFTIKKISPYFCNDYNFIAFIFMYYIMDYLSEKTKKKNTGINYIKRKLLNKNLIILLIKYFFNNYFEDNRLMFLSFDFSLQNFASQIYEPTSLFFINIIFNDLKNDSSNNIFAIQNMTLFYMGLNHDLSSINYEVPFIFCSDFDMQLSVLVMFFYLLYARYNILRKRNDYFLTISTFHVLCTMIIGVWFIDNFLFYFFFAGRCFYVCFYFIFENALCLFK